MIENDIHSLDMPDQYPDQLPNPGVDYRPDPFLIGDNSAEIQKLNHASNEMEAKVNIVRSAQVGIIVQKIGELLSLKGGRSVNLAALNEKLEDTYRAKVSDV